MRVADKIADLLVEHGITHVFMVTGGMSMHLNDAFGNHPKLTCIPFHHEQAAAMAAESYFRMTGRMACLNVTAGPGVTNALTGVWGAYVDSQAMIVISGQVKRETLTRKGDHWPLPLRQLGDQEIDTVGIVSHVTKACMILTDPKGQMYSVKQAFEYAAFKRPGPVWIDIPIDVQGMKWKD